MLDALERAVGSRRGTSRRKSGLDVRAKAPRTFYPRCILTAIKDFGQRLQLIGFVPTALALFVMALFFVGHGPSAPLSLMTVTETARKITVAGGAAMILISGAISITLQPMQFRLVQLLEGYWAPRALAVPFGVGVWLQQRRYDRLQGQLTARPAKTSIGQRLRQERRVSAEAALLSRLPSRERLLPTALGNVLRAMEDRAGARYGIDAIAMWPRLYPVLPKERAQALEDEVTQLDVSARLAVTWMIAGLVCGLRAVTDFGSAMRHPGWLVLTALVLAAAWLSYRSAIESALAHGLDVEVTLDLFRDYLLDAMRMPQAMLLSGESSQFEQLAVLFQADTPEHGIDYSLHARRITGPASLSGS